MQIISLVGMAGCGKSYTGRRLATRLGAHFVDLDEQIERKLGKNIKELIDQYGLPFFRLLELQELVHVVMVGYLRVHPEDYRVVVATGAGAPTWDPTLQVLLEQTCCVWLDTPLTELPARLHTRPRYQELTVEELEASVAETYRGRAVAYEQAHLRLCQPTLAELVQATQQWFTDR